MNTMKVIYRTEHLHCPRCAVRIEDALRGLDGVEAVRLSFSNQQLHLTVTNTDHLLERVQNAATAIDDGVKILDKAHAGHHHAKDYAAEMQKFRCSDPNCHCCDYLPESEKEPEQPQEVPNGIKFVYDVKNIDCAACATKIEHAIRQMNGILSANLSYASGQLHMITDLTDGDMLLEQIRQTTDHITEGVIYTPRQAGKKKTEETENHSELIVFAIGAVLFLIGILISWLSGSKPLSWIFLTGAYLLMGWEILLNSVKNLRKGQIFDENFLMSIATIGAMAIGEPAEAAGVMLFYRLGELFEHFAVEKSRKSVMNAIDMRPETVQKIFSRTDIRTIPAETVQAGDLLLVRAGDRIPVDGIIKKGKSSLDTSAMTGESVPVEVHPGDSVMSGCINLNGVLELEASANLQNSLVSRVLDSVENAAAGKPKIDRFITRFARIYTPVVVGIAVLTAVIPSVITGNWSHWIYTALNFLMISCPCALVLSVPLAFFSGIGAGSEKGILFKEGISLEALVNIKAVVMDKTGTLTKGNFTVTQAETVHCKTEELFRICAACESYSSHPTAKSILAYMQEQQIDYPDAKQVRELAGRGIMGIVNGMQVACGNEKLMQELDVSYPEEAVDGTCVYVAVDGKYYGRLVLSDAPKEHAEETISELNRRGIYTVMLTGDSPAHTESIAEQLHVQEAHAGLLPTEKPVWLQKIRDAHGAVMFVGDGINDAPVLSGADVGAAMGSGADAAMEAADLVLMHSDPQNIVTAMEIAQRVNQTARLCIFIAMAVKLIIMLLGFAGFANMWLSVFADTGVTILCILIVLFRIYFYYKKK